MIKLKRLKARNFLSLGEIEVDLDNRGLVVIEGINRDSKNADNNGSGKSSLIDAIVYTLYGKTIRGATGDDVVNRVNKSNTEVVLEFLVDTNLYKVVRRRKTSKNNIELWLNGKNITPHSESSLNLEIERLLGMSFKIFTSSVVFTDKSMKLASASSKSLKELFEDILNIEYLQRCYERASSSLSDCMSYKEKLVMRISGVKSQIEMIDKYIEEAKETYTKKLEEKEDMINKAIINLEDCKTELEIQSDTLKLLEDEKIELVEELSELKSKILSSIPEFPQEDPTDRLARELDTLYQEYRTLFEEKEEMESSIRIRQKKLKTIRTEIKSLQSTLEKGVKAGDICKVCGNIITEEFVEESTKELRQELKTLEDTYNSLSEKQEEEIELSNNINSDSAYKKYTDKKKSNQDEINKYKDEKAKFIAKHSNESLMKKITAKEKELSRLDQNIKDSTISVTKSKSTIEHMKEEIKRLKALEIVDESYKFSKNKEDNLSAIVELNKELVILNDRIKVLEFWKEGFSNKGIKQLLLEDVTPQLNKTVNEYIKHFQENTFIEFSTIKFLKSGDTREDFNVTIYKGDTKIPYYMFSGGEKKRIDIAITLALQDLVYSRSGVGLNVVFLDEIFDALDTTGIESVISLLSELSKSRSSVFTITHNSELKAYFNSVITIEKSKGVSSIK